MEFTEVLETHGELIKRVVKKFSGKYSEADDLFQEALIAVWQATDSFSPDRGSPAAYFSYCARSAILRQLRRDSNYYSHNTSLNDINVENLSGMDLTLVEVEEIMRQAKQKCQLRSFRRGLYAIQRKMEGRSYRKTAQELGISVATMKRHCGQAFRVLEKLI